MRQSNSEFEQISPLEHLFHCNFSSATTDEEGEWLTAMEIFNYLQENTRDKLSVNKINWFGRILHKLNVPKKSQYQRYFIPRGQVGIIYFSRNEYEVNASYSFMLPHQ